MTSGLISLAGGQNSQRSDFFLLIFFPFLFISAFADFLLKLDLDFFLLKGKYAFNVCSFMSV